MDMGDLGYLIGGSSSSSMFDWVGQLIAQSIVWFIVIVVVCIVIRVGLAFIPSSIARKRGYGFAGFFLLALFTLPILTIMISLCLPNRRKEMDQILSAMNSVRMPVPPARPQAPQAAQPAQTQAPQHRICPACGTDNEGPSAFCGNCGAKL